MVPVMNYFGGKYRLAPWIIQHLPDHQNYVEPYMGACSVLLLKHRVRSEVINDINGEVVNLFKVLRNPLMAMELERIIALTPYARDEYDQAWQPADDMIEQARRTLVKNFMGYGGRQSRKPGFRAREIGSGLSKAQTWAKYPDFIEVFTERLRGVCIENRPALDVIARQSHPATLYYVDPPYLRSSRIDPDKGYKDEMTEKDHIQLAALLHQVEGMVIVSGYDCPLYRDLYSGWTTDQVKSRTNFHHMATEMVWMNYPYQVSLF